MSLDGVKLSVWDVGGHATLRDFWSNYYENANSLIYVIDAADEKRMQESGNVLMKLLAVIFTFIKYRKRISKVFHYWSSRIKPISHMRLNQMRYLFFIVFGNSCKNHCVVQGQGFRTVVFVFGRVGLIKIIDC
jgi:hypothetical protein